MKPIRVRLSRKEGYEKPDNTVVVTRPGRFGNPFRLGVHTIIMDHGHERFATRAECVEAFRADALARPEFVKQIRDELRGKNIACWCELSQSCHGDVLLEIANSVDVADAA